MALRFLLLAFVFILNGCASATGPVFKSAEISKDKALIYVYRKDLGHWQSAYSPTFILDEKGISFEHKLLNDNGKSFLTTFDISNLPFGHYSDGY